MARQFVRLLADVDCEWEGLSPTYRAYVNDELFAERTWIWTDRYLEECFQIEAEPGEYHIRYELVAPHLARLTVKNLRVDYGSGTVENDTLRIVDETV
jgi:hypothetical protein